MAQQGCIPSVGKGFVHQKDQGPVEFRVLKIRDAITWSISRASKIFAIKKNILPTFRTKLSVNGRSMGHHGRSQQSRNLAIGGGMGLHKVMTIVV
jgi:hypothetical protein